MKNTVRTRWKNEERWLSLILYNARTSARDTSLLLLEFEEQEQDYDASMTAASSHARVEAGVFSLSWSSSCCHRHDHSTRSRLPYAISRCPVRFKAPKRSLPRPAASGWQPVLCMTGKLLHAARTHSSPRSRFCQLFTHTTDVSTDALVSTSYVESNLPRFNSVLYYATIYSSEAPSAVIPPSGQGAVTPYIHTLHFPGAGRCLFEPWPSSGSKPPSHKSRLARVCSHGFCIGSSQGFFWA